VTISPQACILGNVEIKSGAWIGAGATINQGTNLSKRMIGFNTIIGSGAVVLRDCDADSVYVGVPARKIK
jgi:acetyltransferase-like isoleucine patch superfamily enzyme